MILDLTLKAAAMALLLVHGIQYLLSSEIPLGPVLIANVMLVISIFSRTRPQQIAVIALVLAVVTTVSAFRNYAAGESAGWVAMLTLVMFCCVALVAMRTLIAHSGRKIESTEDPSTAQRQSPSAKS